MNLRTRVVSGALLAGLLVAAVWLRGAAFYLVAAAAAGAGLWEYSGLMRRIGVAPLSAVLYPLAAWLLFRFELPGRWQPLELGLGAAVAVGLTACLVLRLGIGRWASAIAGSLYVGLTLGYFLALLDWRPHDGRFGSRLVTVVLLAVAATDIAAYVAGSVYGRRRFFPSISPKKTVEGSAAGVLAAVVVTTALAPWLLGMSLPAAAGLGLLIAVSAEGGDLAESALKREAQVKDSGTLVPGHGGLLDRLDSVLLVGPAVYGYLLTLGMG